MLDKGLLGLKVRAISKKYQIRAIEIAVKETNTHRHKHLYSDEIIVIDRKPI